MSTATISLMLSGVALAGAAPASASTFLGRVSMKRACADQYPGQGLRPVLLDRHDAYTWRCASPDGYLGHIDVNRQCVTEHGDGAFAGLWDRSKPHSWYCQR